MNNTQVVNCQTHPRQVIMQKYGTSIFIKQSQPKRNNSQKGPHSFIPLLLFADNVINIPVNSIEW